MKSFKEFVTESSKTFSLDGMKISFTQKFLMDKAINILLKHGFPNESSLKGQLGNNNKILLFTNPKSASMAYNILLKSDIEKATSDDASEFTEGLFKDISKVLIDLGYKVKRTGATNGFHILSKDGLVTAYVVADPQNKF